MLLAVVLLFTVAACSSEGRIEGAVLTSPRPALDQDGMSAQVLGTVVYDEVAGCLYLELEGVRYPVVWPAGTRWQDDPPAVVLSGGVRVEPGMSVEGGGGWLQPEQIRDSVGDAVVIEARRCLGPTGEVAVFNFGSKVEISEG